MEADAIMSAKLSMFENREEMALRLSSDISARLARAIADKGRASLAVSGGSTPAALYSFLSKSDLDWSKVNIVLVDERWVRPGVDGSNETFVKETLLQNNAAALDNLANKAERVGAVIDKDAAKAIKNMNDSSFARLVKMNLQTSSKRKLKLQGKLCGFRARTISA